MEYALLSCENGFNVFSHNGLRVRFKAPYSLENYTEIKEWNDGYIVAMAKYSHNSVPEEEYIDLLPILNDLYIDKEHFLKGIEEVRIANA